MTDEMMLSDCHGMSALGSGMRDSVISNGLIYDTTTNKIRDYLVAYCEPDLAVRAGRHNHRESVRATQPVQRPVSSHYETKDLLNRPKPPLPLGMFALKSVLQLQL